MRRKILVIINDIKRAQEHEWFISLINHELFEIEFALINSKNSAMDNFLVAHKITVHHFQFLSKKELPKLIFLLYRLMRKGKYQIIHTHLFNASLAGLTAGYLSRIPKRVMTRHHSDYHHAWFPSTVKYDKFMNFLATDLVAISKNVEKILIDLENVPASKVRLIHHGLNLSEYKDGAVSEARINAIRLKYDLVNKDEVVGAISRFTEWKGLQYLIPAFKKLILKRPNSVLVLANAVGDYSKHLFEMLQDVPKENLRIIKFENDIAALYKVFQCFVHIPINKTAEAFGQTYIESLASGIPSIFTLSGIAPEFAIHKENCFIVPYCDENAVYDSLINVLDNKWDLDSVIKEGRRIVNEKFDVQLKIQKLEKLYLEN